MAKKNNSSWEKYIKGLLLVNGVLICLVLLLDAGISSKIITYVGFTGPLPIYGVIVGSICVVLSLVNIVSIPLYLLKRRQSLTLPKTVLCFLLLAGSFAYFIMAFNAAGFEGILGVGWVLLMLLSAVFFGAL